MLCSSPPRPRREYNETDVLVGLETRRPLGAVEAAREVDGARRNPSATPPPPPPPSFYIKVLLHVEKNRALINFLFFPSLVFFFALFFFVLCGVPFRVSLSTKKKGGGGNGGLLKANQKGGKRHTLLKENKGKKDTFVSLVLCVTH